MSQFSSDLRVVIFVLGLYWGIRTLLKEYKKNKTRANKKCFIFFILAVFFWELIMFWGIIMLCSDFFANVKNIGCYAIFCWALLCFNLWGYVFTDARSNGDVSQVDKFKGKVAFCCGIYFVLVAIMFHGI